VLPHIAWAQAQTSILSLSVAYNTRKIVANPTGSLKARLDSLDANVSAANRAGNIAEVRRLLAKGNTLLAGREWTDSADYSTSLLLRSDFVIIESQLPYVLRIAQQYQPTRANSGAASAQVRLLSAAGGQNQVIKELGRFEGVRADMRATPFAMRLDLHDVQDGRYTIAVNVLDSGRVIGSTALPIVLKSGLNQEVSQLEQSAKSSPASLRAEILYPIDRMRHVNSGLLELRTLDVQKDFAAAEAIAAAAKAGTDPFAGRTGDMKRHYLLSAANEIMPYHVYVPSNYKADTSVPLIIALHGLGATEDSFFDSYGRKLPELAEADGYILITPLGYRVDGGYGWGIGTAPSDSNARRSSELSELDVMKVLAQVRTLYNIDAKRIYLMGHSLGAIGTWKIAAKFPDMWAAIGLFSGQGTPSSAEQMKGIPQFIVHGDADPTVNVGGSRTMVAALKAFSAPVEYIEVPGGNHSNVVQPNLAAMVQFFNAHRKP
jgi:predicted esterase